jgi:hypothetical protein
MNLDRQGGQCSASWRAWPTVPLQPPCKVTPQHPRLLAPCALLSFAVFSHDASFWYAEERDLWKMCLSMREDLEEKPLLNTWSTGSGADLFASWRAGPASAPAATSQGDAATSGPEASVADAQSKESKPTLHQSRSASRPVPFTRSPSPEEVVASLGPVRSPLFVD